MRYLWWLVLTCAVFGLASAAGLSIVLPRWPWWGHLGIGLASSFVLYPALADQFAKSDERHERHERTKQK